MTQRKYRDVTEDDIGKMIEVTDFGIQFDWRVWQERTLKKISLFSKYKFRTTSREAFKYARIEVADEPA